MNEESQYLPEVTLNEEQKQTIQQMAALSFRVEEIGHALELRGDILRSFIRDASQPDSVVYALLHEGSAIGRSNSEIKLHQLAEAGNVDAIKELRKVQVRHRYQNLLKTIDEDEIYSGDAIWGQE